MSLAEDVAEFVDHHLYAEATEERAAELAAQLDTDLEIYGASTGAVRGTIRNALRRWPDLTHDDVTAAASALWARPVHECRAAAVVLLQIRARDLTNTDLTRIEGFLRTTETEPLVDQLARDVVVPLRDGLDDGRRARADQVLDRWSASPLPSLRRAAEVARMDT